MLDTANWSASDHVVFSALDDGIALLDTSSNVYYALEGIGPFLWERLVEGNDFADLCDAVTATFDVDSATARADVAEWLDAMAKSGLVTERRA